MKRIYISIALFLASLIALSAAAPQDTIMKLVKIYDKSEGLSSLYIAEDIDSIVFSSVKFEADLIRFEERELTLNVGETAQIHGGVSSSQVGYYIELGFGYADIEWTCTPESVVSVSVDGVITAKAKGMATIFAELPNGKIANCIVNVTDAEVIAGNTWDRVVYETLQNPFYCPMRNENGDIMTLGEATGNNSIANASALVDSAILAAFYILPEGVSYNNNFVAAESFTHGLGMIFYSTFYYCAEADIVLSLSNYQVLDINDVPDNIVPSGVSKDYTPYLIHKTIFNEQLYESYYTALINGEDINPSDYPFVGTFDAELIYFMTEDDGSVGLYYDGPVSEGYIEVSQDNNGVYTPQYDIKAKAFYNDPNIYSYGFLTTVDPDGNIEFDLDADGNLQLAPMQPITFTKGTESAVSRKSAEQSKHHFIPIPASVFNSAKNISKPLTNTLRPKLSR